MPSSSSNIVSIIFVAAVLYCVIVCLLLHVRLSKNVRRIPFESTLVSLRPPSDEVERVATYPSDVARTEGCDATVVMVEPFVTNETLWVLESAAANVIAKNPCFVLFTSSCPSSSLASDPSFVARLLRDAARPRLLSMVDRGLVRVKALDHERYGVRSCDDFSPISNVLMSARFWGGPDEFVPGVDSDTVLLLQNDSVLCQPLNVTVWRRFAFVGAPWADGGRCVGLRARWREWSDEWIDTRFYPSTERLCRDPVVAPVGNGGLSIRSRAWLVRAIERCPHVSRSGLDDARVASARCRVPTSPDGSPYEDAYFAAVLRGMASTKRRFRARTPVDAAPVEEDDDDDAPTLPTLYEASLFAAETAFLDHFQDRYALDEQKVCSTVDRLWSEGGSERYKRMREAKKKDSTFPVVPIGLHKIWHHHPNLTVLRGKAFDKECPYLKYVAPWSQKG